LSSDEQFFLKKNKINPFSFAPKWVPDTAWKYTPKVIPIPIDAHTSKQPGLEVRVLREVNRILQ
jgi:hypothetical protein